MARRQRESARSKINTTKKKIDKSIDINQPRHFDWIRMWISYALSIFMKDRGKIPDNIGDRILISNNMYITKLFMSTIINVQELGPTTPETMIEVLNKQLRNRGNTAVLDFSLKNTKYVYDPKKGGMDARIATWERMASGQTLTTPRYKERAVRCLYTIKEAEAGRTLKHTRMFITIRSKDIRQLNQAEKIVIDNLNAMGCTYLPAYSNIADNLEYMSIFGNYTNDLKSMPPIMTSNIVLSGLLPNCGSLNDTKGLYMGQNILNGTPYFLDVDNISVARNLYIVAPSGVGKTVLALNMAQSAYENGNACCLMDIKGNEYTEFIKATNGYIISLRPNSIEYINSWKMNPEDVKNDSPVSYFNSRVQFSKQQFIILSGLKEKEQLTEFEELLDEFHHALYVQLGCIASNMNSWQATQKLTPYSVFSMFEDYLTPDKMEKYSLPKSILGTLRMYMSESGSKSYVFKQEFDYSSILNANTISFDFGILSNSTIADIDVDLFRLKFLYMSKLNGEFVTNNFNRGIRTLKVLEESQIVSPEILHMYVEEYTLRRSQNQDTLLLGNSVSALMDNTLSKPIIENTTGLLVGELGLEARNKVMDEFGIRRLEKFIKIPGSKPEYKNSFFFLNNMEDKTIYPIIKVVVDKNLPNKIGRKFYKVMKPAPVKNDMSGDIGTI